MSNRGTNCSSSRAIAISGMAWPRPLPREKYAMPNAPGSNGFGRCGASAAPCMCFFLLMPVIQDFHFGPWIGLSLSQTANC
jgi:hypothetical protein